MVRIILISNDKVEKCARVLRCALKDSNEDDFLIPSSNLFHSTAAPRIYHEEEVVISTCPMEI